MRISEFNRAAAALFGADYAPTLLKDLALTDLNSLTAVGALAAGIPPRDVWHALCDQMGVPAQDQDAGDAAFLIPPKRMLGP